MFIKKGKGQVCDLPEWTTAMFQKHGPLRDVEWVHGLFLFRLVLGKI